MKNYMDFFIAGWAILAIILFIFVPPYNIFYNYLKTSQDKNKPLVKLKVNNLFGFKNKEI